MLNIYDVTEPIRQEAKRKRIYEETMRGTSGGRDRARGGSSLEGTEAARERDWAALRAAMLKTLDAFPEAREALVQTLREMDDQGTE